MRFLLLLCLLSANTLWAGAGHTHGHRPERVQAQADGECSAPHQEYNEDGICASKPDNKDRCDPPKVRLRGGDEGCGLAPTPKARVIMDGVVAARSARRQAAPDGDARGTAVVAAGQPAPPIQAPRAQAGRSENIEAPAEAAAAQVQVPADGATPRDQPPASEGETNSQTPATAGDERPEASTQEGKEDLRSVYDASSCEWVQDMPRKIHNAPGCGRNGVQICVGYVVCNQKENPDLKFVRTASCRPEHCGAEDSDAVDCVNDERYTSTKAQDEDRNFMSRRLMDVINPSGATPR